MSYKTGYIILVVMGLLMITVFCVSMGNNTRGGTGNIEYVYRVIIIDTLNAQADTTYLQLNGYYKNAGGHVMPEDRIQPLPVIKGGRLPHNMLDSVCQSLWEVNPGRMIVVSELAKVKKTQTNKGE